MNDLLNYYYKIKRPLVLDGAIGSILQQRNVPINKYLWSSFANIVAPEEVIKVHKEYVDAGADIITTNTFRTNPIAFNQAGMGVSNNDIVKAAVVLAKESVVEMNRRVFIAGSNPPAEDSYQEVRKISQSELERNHKYHIDMLKENGVDFILNETQSHMDEINIICEHCNRNSIPFIVSLFVTEEGKIMSGESFFDVIERIQPFNPVAIAINCVLPATFRKLMGNIKIDYHWGFYLNCGSGSFTDSEIFEGVSPSDYITVMEKYLGSNPLFIGTCCGSSPSHTKVIKEYILGKD